MKFTGSSYEDANVTLGDKTSVTFDGGKLVLERRTTGAILVKTNDVDVGLIPDGDIVIQLKPASEGFKQTSARYRINQFLPAGIKAKISDGKFFLGDKVFTKEVVVMGGKVITDTDMVAAVE